MRLNRKGITAMADAMIFVVVMGLAIGAFAMYDNDEIERNDASIILDLTLGCRINICEMIDTKDTTPVPLPELLAASLISGDRRTFDYLVETIDSATGMPGEYSLTVTYGELISQAGNGLNNENNGCTRNIELSIGGTLTVELTLP